MSDSEERANAVSSQTAPYYSEMDLLRSTFERNAFAIERANICYQPTTEFVPAIFSLQGQIRNEQPKSSSMNSSR